MDQGNSRNSNLSEGLRYPTFAEKGWPVLSYSKAIRQPVKDNSDHVDILVQLKSKQLLMVDSHRRSGLIICKQFHAEFAGPGAAVGSLFDADCNQIFPVGDLSLTAPQSHEERQKAFLIRRQWILLTQQFTDNSVPLDRAQTILNQLDGWGFNQQMVEQIPDDIFALLIGVLPPTVRKARHSL